MHGDYPLPHVGVTAPRMYNGTSSLADPTRITCNVFVYASNCARVTQALDAQHAPWRETKEWSWGMTAPAGLAQDERQLPELVYDDVLT